MSSQRPKNPYSRGGAGYRPESYGRQPPNNAGRKAPDPSLTGTAPPWTNALAIARDRTRLSRLSFGCEHLDGTFEGGIPVQGITEIVGEAGAGKTQLCLQLLLQAQLPPDMGGLGGKSYVLTCGEGDFPSRRLQQIASRYRDRNGLEQRKLMDGVCIQNARNLDEQMKIMMEHLPVLMEDHGIKLVVVDSIAALFRSDMGHGRSDIGERSRRLGQLSQQMKRLGDRHRAAFVVVNQVTARFGPPTGGAGTTTGGGSATSTSNIPAMGLLWSQCINTRFMVRRREFRLPLRPRDGAGAEGGRRSTSSAEEDVFNTSTLESSVPKSKPGSLGCSSGSGSCSGSVRNTTAIAREITLEMSPSMPVHSSCGFVIDTDGVTGVGWDGGTGDALSS